MLTKVKATLKKKYQRKKNPFLPTRILLTYDKELTRRFKKIKKEIESGFFNIFLPQQTILKKPPFEYKYSETKYLQFMDFIRAMLFKELGFFVSIKQANRYYASRYISEAYIWGVDFMDQEFNELIKPIAQSLLIRPISRRSPLLIPQHLTRSRLLYARQYSQLKNISNLMESQISNVLGEGMLKGENPKTLAYKLRKRAGVNLKRARLIARTECIHALNQAKLNESVLLNEYFDDEIKFKWLTVRDAKVRPEHRRRNGKRYTRKQVSKLIGEPNCRCSIVPSFELDKIKKQYKN